MNRLCKVSCVDYIRNTRCYIMSTHQWKGNKSLWSVKCFHFKAVSFKASLAGGEKRCSDRKLCSFKFKRHCSKCGTQTSLCFFILVSSSVTVLSCSDALVKQEQKCAISCWFVQWILWIIQFPFSLHLQTGYHTHWKWVWKQSPHPVRRGGWEKKRLSRNYNVMVSKKMFLRPFTESICLQNCFLCREFIHTTFIFPLVENQSQIRLPQG